MEQIDTSERRPSKKNSKKKNKGFKYKKTRKKKLSDIFKFVK